MVELVDALDLGSSGEIHAGSSPAGGTKANKQQVIKALEDGNGSHRPMLGDAGNVALPNAKISLRGKGRLIRLAWDEENEGSNPSAETNIGE